MATVIVLDCSAQAYSSEGSAVVWSIPAVAQVESCRTAKALH